MTQAQAKCKSAIYKSKLADANLQEAAADIYLHHINWTIQHSNYKDIWWKQSSQVKTVTDSGLNGTKVNHFINVPGGSVAITLD
ncbi:hypothetical protein BJV74DRAFT_890216 [Russula compacta]|nr:hypothetical protein BJV74DRAFT_890216 [Russula compacta]